MRIVIVVKRTEDGRHQASLRLAAGGNAIFYSRKEQGSSQAKRAAELLFGKLEWQPVPDALKQSEPTANQIAYFNG